MTGKQTDGVRVAQRRDETINWTPYQMMLILHYHVSHGPFQHTDAPIWRGTVDDLVDRGYLSIRPEVFCYKTTAKGAALVAAWQNTFEVALPAPATADAGVVSDEMVERFMTAMFGEYNEQSNYHTWVSPSWPTTTEAVHAATGEGVVSEIQLNRIMEALFGPFDPKSNYHTWVTPNRAEFRNKLRDALASALARAGDGWRDIADLPKDRDDTYLVCVENDGSKPSVGNPGWVDKGWIAPHEDNRWLNDANMPIERGPWKVTKWKTWPRLPPTHPSGKED